MKPTSDICQGIRGKAAICLILVAVVLSTAVAGFVMMQPDETDESNDGILGGSPESDWKMVAKAYVDSDKNPIRRNIIVNVKDGVINPNPADTNYLEDCVRTDNGLLFSFTNPYAEVKTSVYGLNLIGHDRYDHFNFIPHYDPVTREQTLEFRDYALEESDRVPLAWICGYDPVGTPGDTLHIPAVITYNGLDYYVYGCLDGSDIWVNRSFFGLNAYGDQTLGHKVMMACKNVVVHIAYDHYVLPSGLFRENPYIESLSLEYVGYEIKGTYSQDKGQQTFYSRGYLFFLGDLAFYKCDKLSTLDLPDKMDCMGYNCFASTSLEELYFDTSVHSFQSYPMKKVGNTNFGGYTFAGIPTLTKLFIGKNVDNLPDNLFTGVPSGSRGGYEMCREYSSNIKVVYDLGASVTQSAILKALQASDPKIGSNNGVVKDSSGNPLVNHRILLFNLCGGDLTREAVITEDTVNNTFTVTAPHSTITYSGGTVEVPAWGISANPAPVVKKVLTDESVTLSGYNDFVVVFNGTCIITYKLNDTVLGTQDIPCEYASTIYGPDVFHELDDFPFVLWNTKKDGTGTEYLPGQTALSVSNMTLYAYGKTDFKITYYFSSESVMYTSNITYSIYDDNIFPSTVGDFPSKTAQSQKKYNDIAQCTHWSTSADGKTGRLFAFGTDIELIDNMTLYAVAHDGQNLSTFTLTYRYGDDEQTVTFTSADKKPTFTLSLNMFSNGSKQFRCWMDENGKTYNARSSITFDTTKDQYSHTVTPVWREGTGTVVFHYGPDSTVTSDQTVTLWEDTILNTPSGSEWEKPGYEILGWATSPEASYISYVPGMSVFITENMLTSGKLHLYAIWTEKERPYVVVVLNNSLIVRDGDSHEVYTGHYVLGLDQEYELELTIVRCDSEGNIISGDLEVSETGVHYFTADCVVKKDGVVIADPPFNVCPTVGMLAILKNSGFSSVHLGFYHLMD